MKREERALDQIEQVVAAKGRATATLETFSKDFPQLRKKLERLGYRIELDDVTNQYVVTRPQAEPGNE